ncbi:MAG: isoprenyl transferase [Marinovum algicola]|uniref:isoprenyl transferase n=1 Tax=Marinovum algicola TaxID=42444 RepID=UPI0032EB5AC1
MMQAIDPKKGERGTPGHVAIIMDGNGRWARARGLPRTEGHRKGAESVRRAVTAARELGIGYLTLFGFSSENWKRPSWEVVDLMQLLRHYLRSEIAELHRHDVRFRVIGERDRLEPEIVQLIERGEETTRNNSALTLTIALSYGARREIVLAARFLAEEVAAGRLNPAKIDEDSLARHLFTADMPDPDLIIRTSGEKRISNFLLWQAAYAEFVFLEKLWPDFGKEDLTRAIEEFHSRERRYGA